MAGNELDEIGVPTDEYNGLTVGASQKHNDDVFRRVTTDNNVSIDADAVGPRTTIDLVAPGFLIDAAGPNGSQPPRTDSTGTSFAAPHVTGTVALLQQHATNQMSSSVNAKRHEVIKAVLMNSADKIQGVLGMDRTVVKINGTDTWLQSDAHTDPNVPLDIEMGAGHLNAERALQQFSPGEFEAGNVPLIGWDYGFVDDTTSPQKYVLNQMLPAGSHVSATLVWDRQVVLDALSPPFDEYKPGDEFIDNAFFNLDLHLLPAGSTNKNQAIWSSTSTAHNLEHMLASISTTWELRTLG